MRFLLPSLLIACVACAARAQAPDLPAGTARFTIVQANDGKNVGSADCAVTTAAGGYQIDSRGDMKLAKFSYSFVNNNRLDTQLNMVRDQLSGTVNGAQVTFNLASDTTGRQFQVNIVSSGKTTTNTFDRHQHTALLPDLDPAAYLAMVHFALERPPTTWIVIPKQNGLLVPAQYNAQPDVRGTFHGQPVDSHHTSVIVSEENGISVELYYTSEGVLLEADLPEQNFYVIRDDFRLQNRPHYSPPHGQASPAGQGQPQASGQPPQYAAPRGASQPLVQPEARLQAN